MEKNENLISPGEKPMQKCIGFSCKIGNTNYEVSGYYTRKARCWRTRRRRITPTRAFLPPEHETAAASGTPAAADSYQTLPVKEGYSVGIDTNPVCRDGVLNLNVANEAGNTVWFLVRVYQEDKKIAQTGILYPGEYIGEVECERGLAAGETITVQTVAYEPETYHSEGIARIICEVAGE